MSEAQTERRVPEHPGWRKQWIKYAEYEGRRVVLHREGHRFAVCSGWHDFGRVTDPETIVALYAISDSLADAEAAFAEACERLREGG